MMTTKGGSVKAAGFPRRVIAGGGVIKVQSSAPMQALRADGGMTALAKDTYNVLFLCTGNSARSILAEAILNRLGNGRFHAYSAGSSPQPDVNPMSMELLERLKYDTGFARSKSWDEFARPDAPAMDFVFTVCDNAAGEACPIWPGRPMSAHWGVPDPAAAQGSDAEKRIAFGDAYRMLERRISAFVSLPLAQLDTMTLGQRLKSIGDMES